MTLPSSDILADFLVIQTSYQMPQPGKAIFCFLSLLCISCGGGGGGGGNTNPTNPSPAPPPVNEAPVADFTLNTTSGSSPLVITVDASESSDADGTIVSYTWDFSGVSAIGSVAQYTFSEPGEYAVTLTVSDDEGASDSASKQVTVDELTNSASLSGEISILSSSAIDSDVNDRLTTPKSNNNFAQAQNLPSPVTVGGFSNLPGEGEPTGNFYETGDPADFYKVRFSGGELISLDIAESDADLDLRLWGADQSLIDASLGLSQNETLRVPGPGTYFLEVLPFSGSSSYVLYIGQDPSITSLNRPITRLSDAFIPGELIIKHSASEFTRLTLEAATTTAYPIRPLSPRMRLPSGDSGFPAELGLYGLKNHLAETQVHLNLPSGGRLSDEQRLRMQTLNALKAWSKQSGVSYAEPNLRVQAHAVANDSFRDSQWHYDTINLTSAWDVSTGSNEVIVAVVDTGVLLEHPDLKERLVAGYDFISDPATAGDGDGIDADPNDPGDKELPGNVSSFHGTHVAGTIGASTNNSIGTAGVTWQTRIMPLRGLGRGGGSTFDILQAVRYAAGLSNSSGTVPQSTADIINLSIGSTFSSQSEQETYLEIAQAGIFVVASSGNEASSVPSYPAAYQGVISVAATNIANERADYSNFGPSIDIAAPGGSPVTDLNGDGIADGIISTIGNDSGLDIEYGYAQLSGTSMAAPHVSGVIALMKAIYPALTPVDFEAALTKGDITNDLGDPGRDDFYGYGLINAQKAVTHAQQLSSGQSVSADPILSASVTTLNFGSTVDQLAFNLLNVGGGSVAVTDAVIQADWVTLIEPESEDGLGRYTIEINRSGLPEGAYQTTLTFTSDENSVSVRLLMQVSSINFSADAGLFYVILVDENGDTQAQTLVNAEFGVYSFTFSDVPVGQYRLYAGSDTDDDSRICDAGEACGAYPALDSPELIAINRNLSDLNFDAGFRVNLVAQQTATGDTVQKDQPLTLVVSKREE